jgi:hypothetical protein
MRQPATVSLGPSTNAVIGYAADLIAPKPPRQESFTAGSSASGSAEEMERYASVFMGLSLLLLAILLAVALYVAYSAGGGWRNYVPAALDPWAYILLRIVFPGEAA